MSAHVLTHLDYFQFSTYRRLLNLEFRRLSLNVSGREICLQGRTSLVYFTHSEQ